ncbi:neutral/alkaline non-lysosomal ceramidase N-terminal domain-containing protein, partial [Alcanivorax sp. HI0083]
NWKVEVSSLANGYFGYAVTPEEYQRQYYEGGHTLYGPHTLDFLIGQSSELSRDLQQSGNISGNINDIPRQQTFSLLAHQYFPEAQQTAAPASPTAVQWQGHPTREPGDLTTGPYWRISLLAAPAEQLALDTLELTLHCQGQRATTDDGAALQLQWQAQQNSQDKYEVRWYPAPGQPQTGCRFAFSANPAAPVQHSPAIP